MNSGTAAELKASEAMVKKDHAGVCSGAVQCSEVTRCCRCGRAVEAVAAALQRSAFAHGGGRRNRQRGCSAPPCTRPFSPLTPIIHTVLLSSTQFFYCSYCMQASIEALDKRMRECAWAQKFCAAMAALQVVTRPRSHAATPSHLTHQMIARRRPTRLTTAALQPTPPATRSSCCTRCRARKTLRCRCCRCRRCSRVTLVTLGTIAEQSAHVDAGAGGAGWHAAVEHSLHHTIMWSHAHAR